jgi:hypothetical protein
MDPGGRPGSHERKAVTAAENRWFEAGVLGIVAYDASKAVLSLADPSPYNPFEAIRVFGVLLVGDHAPPIQTWASGAAFHLLNGVMFAIAYAQFLGAFAARSVRLAVVTGMAWGLFLETFQLVLFPGWLSITFVAEFTTISMAAHLVYGATVGTVVRRRLLWFAAGRHATGTTTSASQRDPGGTA